MGAVRIGLKLAAGGAVLAVLALPALAEEAVMVGRFPAQYRDAAMLRSLSVERFSGRDGPALSFAIERALNQPDARGEVHFDLVSPSRRSGGGYAEGTLSGVVSSGVDESFWKRKDKKCVERDAKKKCIKEEEKEVRCTRRVINVNADLRIARGDGRIVYSVTRPVREERSWCPEAGERAPSTVEESIKGMIDGIANQLASEITPRWSRYSVRYRESTKGLPKDLAKRFRTSMKQSEKNRKASCADWAEIDRLSPGNPSITFDLGLCAEADGDYTRAVEYYRRADPLLGREDIARTGIARINNMRTALADDAARDGRR